MKTSTQLASRFREVILDGTWIANTNYKDQLSKVSLEEANYKAYSFNTIAALTFHINYYIAGVLNVFENGTLDIRDKYSFDFAPLETPDDWNTLKASLWHNAETLAEHIETLTENELKAYFVDEKYGSYQRNIDGLIEHAYYHLGQIVMLKKLFALKN